MERLQGRIFKEGLQGRIFKEDCKEGGAGGDGEAETAEGRPTMIPRRAAVVAAARCVN